MKACSGIIRRPRKSKKLFLRAAYYLFLAGGICGLGYAAYVVVDAQAYQAIEKSRFDTMRPAQGPRVVAEGDVIGEMKIPRLELETILVQGESPKILRRAVGHLPETALPGEPGDVALVGHRDSFFRPLRNIQLGDAITIKTLDGEFEYQVERTEVVLPSDVQVLQPSSENTLTLVTCFPFYYVGPAPKRFIVRARQIGRLPEQSPTTEAPLHF
ncbi:MAG: class D sortase [Candidatus Acidiferrales bacterium]